MVMFTFSPLNVLFLGKTDAKNKNYQFKTKLD